MLFVLVEQVVEDLLIEQSDALKVISASRFKAHNLINQVVRLVRQVRYVLLSLHLLAHICRIVADLELYGVYTQL